MVGLPSAVSQVLVRKVLLSNGFLPRINVLLVWLDVIRELDDLIMQLDVGILDQGSSLAHPGSVESLLDVADLAAILESISPTLGSLFSSSRMVVSVMYHLFVVETNEAVIDSKLVDVCLHVMVAFSSLHLAAIFANYYTPFN